jgi:hypothetical protein
MITVADLARYRLESKFAANPSATDGAFPVSFADSATAELGQASAVVAPAFANHAEQLR